MANMLKEALSLVEGPLGQLWKNLCGNDGERWVEELKKFLRKEPCWSEKNTVKKVSSRLFEFLGSVSIPATTEKFVAKDKFIIDTSEKAKVKISYLDQYFKDCFLEKIEEAFAGSTIYCRQLNKKSVDDPILAELGNQEETTLTEIYALMERQANGEAGELLTNGHANIFYVRDINDTLQAVYVLWNVAGWIVKTFPVGYMHGWYVGSRVFSHNSSGT